METKNTKIKENVMKCDGKVKAFITVSKPYLKPIIERGEELPLSLRERLKETLEKYAEKRGLSLFRTQKKMEYTEEEFCYVVSLESILHEF